MTETAAPAPTDRLAAATRNGAAFLVCLDVTGTIMPDKAADRVVPAEAPGASTLGYRPVTHVLARGARHAVTDPAGP